MSAPLVCVRVEFYGIVRARSGVAEAVVQLPVNRATLGSLVEELGQRYPELGDCMEGSRLGKGFTANLGGKQFVTSPAAVLRDGEVVLLMSADAGG